MLAQGEPPPGRTTMARIAGQTGRTIRARSFTSIIV
jgi:hypothetical protein